MECTIRDPPSTSAQHRRQSDSVISCEGFTQRHGISHDVTATWLTQSTYDTIIVQHRDLWKRLVSFPTPCRTARPQLAPSRRSWPRRLHRAITILEARGETRTVLDDYRSVFLEVTCLDTASMSRSVARLCRHETEPKACSLPTQANTESHIPN